MAVGAAMWTALTLKMDWFQHPKLQRTTYRLPSKRWSAFNLWEELHRKISIQDLSIQVERQHAKKQVWVRLEGALPSADAAGLGQRHAGEPAPAVMGFTSAEWEFLVAIRNLFYKDATTGSIFDELLVVRPPKRIVGGVLVRF